MKVLLFTHNHVVREFVESAVKDIEATLDVADDISDVVDDKYDYVFVDDKVTNIEEIVQGLDNSASKWVIFYNIQNSILDNFDIQIKKPFLPNDIKQILKIDEKKRREADEAQVLDLQEISEIKKLLEEDGVQIVSEEDLLKEIDGNNEDRGTSELEPNSKSEEELLGAILKMKSKKIRKLLNGAEVTIKIKFPKDNNE